MKTIQQKELTIKVKQSAADRGIPMVWYCRQGGKTFKVTPSKEYHRMYEVIEGEFKGKIIEFVACDIVK